MGDTTIQLWNLATTVPSLVMSATNELWPDDGVWAFTDIDGWYDNPDILLDEENMPGQDGGFDPTEAEYTGRRITLTFDVMTAPGGDIRTARWNAFSAIPLSKLRLSVTDPFGTLFSDVWKRGRPRFKLSRVPWIGQVVIDLYAADPRKYRAQEPTTAKPGGGGSGTGLVFPLFDDGTLDFGTFTLLGGFYLSNAGTHESWPIFTVTGLFDTGFTITSDTSVLEFAGAVPAGQAVVLSPYAGGRAILNGTDRTDLLIQSDWAPVGAGATKPYILAPRSTNDANASVTADMRDAFV